jgi:hypothetical protein
LQFCFVPHELASHHAVPPFRQTLHEGKQGSGDDAMAAGRRYHHAACGILAQWIKQCILERKHLCE